ncbi:ATP-binding protein, partial [Pseudomonas sp. R62]|uniref:ATP-binding protein n=1 Tax=Pseudomonas sp. R62 TaxID=1144884 RepID=UPI001EE6674D
MPVHVFADRVKLQQVILNLVINACQAMAEVDPRDRLLKVRNWVHDDEAILEVRNCGAGISEQAFPSLFNPFFTTKADGLGMGLVICRSIIEFHEGRIWATSNQDQGSVF